MENKQNDQRESDLPTKLAQPVRRAFVGAGYTRLEQLCDIRRGSNQAVAWHEPKAIVQLHDALSAKGLSFSVSMREPKGKINHLNRD